MPTPVGSCPMARRIDFYDGPEAPTTNGLVPSVNVVVTNGAGDIAMIRRSDNDTWAVPGGAIDLPPGSEDGKHDQ